jgi:hypothetical protein
MAEKIKRTERGWAGHFIGSTNCKFRRNTLLERGETRIVVSTIGLFRTMPDERIEKVGLDRYFETMAFLSDPNDTRYHDANVEQEVSFDSPWAIAEADADDRANDMHEAVVDELVARLEDGEVFPTPTEEAKR